MAQEIGLRVRAAEAAAFGLLLANEYAATELVHWKARARVAALTTFGLLMAGASIWRALTAGLIAGAICIISGTWQALNFASATVAFAGLCIWALGLFQG
jgi:hypothetical protein